MFLDRERLHERISEAKELPRAMNVSFAPARGLLSSIHGWFPEKLTEGYSGKKVEVKGERYSQALVKETPKYKKCARR